LKDDYVYLQHISEYIEFLISMRAALTYDDLCHDLIKQLAVIKALENIGEASKKVSRATRTAYPDIPWTHMARFRDKTVHRYFDIDFKQVWVVLTKEIPAIEPQIRAAHRWCKEQSPKHHG
jgi:uncharacterized protein with HEPN domain